MSTSAVNCFPFAVFTVLLFLVSSSSSSVNTECGLVQGHTVVVDGGSGSALEFLSIPYAKAERWQPPKRLPQVSGCWSGVYEAIKPGPSCVGRPTPGVTASDMSEDCLSLSVWTPHTKSGSKQAGTKNAAKFEFQNGQDFGAKTKQDPLLPVMVYLHGGSLVEGSSFSIQSAYGAVKNMTRGSVVSVAINYRLAVCGFLALDVLSEFDERGVSGNYGLLDTIEALRWVRDNIQNFGGDPNQVTVYGQSSGGSLVFALLASPKAQGLFSRAISMSGSARLNSTVQEASSYWHLEALRRTRCGNLPLTHNNNKLISCLRSLNISELMGALPPDWHSAAFDYKVFRNDFRYAPLLLVDGEGGVLPYNYLDAYKRRLGAEVHTIIGVTAQEIDFAPGDDVRSDKVSDFISFIADHLSDMPATFTTRLLQIYNLTNTTTNTANMANTAERTEGVSATHGHSAGSDAGRGRRGLEAGPDIDLEQKGGMLASEFLPQKTYAQIVSDLTMFCPNQLLAKTLANQQQRAPLYLYSTPEAPGNPFCPLAPFQSISGYCPKNAFHAVDMFALFRPYWPSSSYNYTKADYAYSELLLARFTEFASTGQVSSWQLFGNQSSSQFVVDLRQPVEEMWQDSLEQCRLFAPYYHNKSLIN